MPKPYWEARYEAVLDDAVRRILDAGADEARIRTAVEQAMVRAIDAELLRGDAEDTAHFGPPD
jgi:hypothetical protein